MIIQLGQGSSLPPLFLPRPELSNSHPRIRGPTQPRSQKDGKQLRPISRAWARLEPAISRQNTCPVPLISWRKREAGLADEREPLVAVRFALCEAVSYGSKAWRNSCNHVPPSARPPHENKVTVSPACRLPSKLIQPCVCKTRQSHAPSTTPTRGINSPKRSRQSPPASHSPYYASPL